MLDLAFELEGFCVVRGPDLLWGGDIKKFHPPSGRFDGVIGGPPCKAFSQLVNLVRAVRGPDSVAENLIPEYQRVVAEANPEWFLSENVVDAPVIEVDGFRVQHEVLNNRTLGQEQNRKRRFCFGSRLGVARFSVAGHEFQLEPPTFENAVTASGGRRCVAVKLGGSGKVKPRAVSGPGNGRTLRDAIRLQGLPDDFLSEAPFTLHGKLAAVGNGVPIPMGRAVARAVKRALGIETKSEVA